MFLPTKDIMRFLLFIFFANVLFSLENFAAPILKKQALDLLKNESVRWKQTQYPANETSAKFEQMKSVDNIHLTVFSRSMVARTNQLFFGFLESGPLNTIGFGVTGIQAGYSAYNKAFTEKIEAAEVNVQAGVEQTKNLQNDLQFLALQKYILIQYQEKRLESAEVAIKKSIEVVRLAKEKMKSGVGLPIDIARSEALLEKDKIKKIEIQAALFKAKKEFFDFVGHSEDRYIFPKLEFKKIKTEQEIKYQQRLVEKPDIRATEYQLQALQHIQKSTEAEKNLRISVFAELGSVGTQAFGLINSVSGSVGVQFEIPLMDGGLNSGKKREVLNQLSHVQFENEKLKKENQFKLEVALEQLKLSEQAAEGTEMLIRSAQTELTLAEKRIKFGSAGNLELINAQSNYVLALEASAQALYTYELSKLNLFYATSDIEGYLQSCEEAHHG